MSDYWKLFFDENSKSLQTSLLKQVGKTVNGQEITSTEIELLVESICDGLDLGIEDRVVDLCCGNGFITKMISSRVKEILAIDFSSGLIEVAMKSSAAPNIRYINDDVVNLGAGYFRGRVKVVMNESLQHFSVDEFGLILAHTRELAAGSLIFFGGVPDNSKIRTFYDTDEKYAFHLRREAEGKPHIGHWWSRADIERIGSGHGFDVQILPQRPGLPSAHYRFDVLLQKNS